MTTPDTSTQVKDAAADAVNAIRQWQSQDAVDETAWAAENKNNFIRLVYRLATNSPNERDKQLAVGYVQEGAVIDGFPVTAEMLENCVRQLRRYIDLRKKHDTLPEKRLAVEVAFEARAAARKALEDSEWNFNCARGDAAGADNWADVERLVVNCPFLFHPRDGDLYDAIIAEHLAAEDAEKLEANAAVQ